MPKWKPVQTDDYHLMPFLRLGKNRGKLRLRQYTTVPVRTGPPSAFVELGESTELTEGKMPKVTVYDNGGKTLDRYTVVIQDKGWGERGPYKAFLGVDDVGGRGFSQFGDCSEGPHLGKKIKFTDMTKATQKHVRARLTEDN